MNGLESQDKPGLDTSKVEPTNRIGIYIRSYSESSGVTVMQERRLRETIDSMNRYRPFGEVVEVFKDHGMSFDIDLRPGIRALKRAVRRKQVTLVFVPELRDLATLPRDLFRLLRFFDRHRCGLRSTHEYLLYEDLRFVAPKSGKDAVEGLKSVSGGLENEPAQ